MNSLLQRLLTFDHMLGPALVKIVYFVGAAFIVCATGFTMVMALTAVAGGNVGAGAMQLIAAPAIGAVAFVYWRFACELFMLAFLSYERLQEIRDRLPDYSQF